MTKVGMHADASFGRRFMHSQRGSLACRVDMVQILIKFACPGRQRCRGFQNVPRADGTATSGYSKFHDHADTK